MKAVGLTMLFMSILIDSYITYLAYSNTIKTVDVEKLPIIRKCDCVITTSYDNYMQVERNIYSKINNKHVNNSNLGFEKDKLTEPEKPNLKSTGPNKTDKGMQEEILRILAEKQQAKLKEVEQKEDTINQDLINKDNEKDQASAAQRPVHDNQGLSSDTNKTPNNIFDLIDE